MFFDDILMDPCVFKKGLPGIQSLKKTDFLRILNFSDNNTSLRDYYIFLLIPRWLTMKFTKEVRITVRKARIKGRRFFFWTFIFSKSCLYGYM